MTIIAINFTLKTAIIKLIQWIGYDTHSEVVSKITSSVFITLFFNTGILLLLTNANLADVSPSLSIIFHATHYDYSPQWYAWIGSTLVDTLKMNIVLIPIVEMITIVRKWLEKM